MWSSDLTAETSWHSFVDQHGEAIFKVAYRVLRNLHDAEDVSQQVLLETYAMKSHPATGIMKRMAAFRAIDCLRKKQRTVPFDEAVHVPSCGLEYQAIEVEEQADLLRLAIARLPPRQAECFWLRYVEGLSNQEIATIQSISQSAVSTALLKARKTLRDSFSMTREHSNE